MFLKNQEIVAQKITEFRESIIDRYGSSQVPTPDVKAVYKQCGGREDSEVKRDPILEQKSSHFVPGANYDSFKQPQVDQVMQPVAQAMPQRQNESESEQEATSGFMESPKQVDHTAKPTVKEQICSREEIQNV